METRFGRGVPRPYEWGNVCGYHSANVFAAALPGRRERPPLRVGVTPAQNRGGSGRGAAGHMDSGAVTLNMVRALCSTLRVAVHRARRPWAVTASAPWMRQAV